MRRSIAALLTAALILAGCSVAPKAPTNSAGDSSLKGTVRVLTLGGPGYEQQLITAFKTAEPGIQVESVQLPEGDYAAIMGKLSSGETKVDAIVAPGNPFLFSLGIASPLDDLIAKNKLDLQPYGTALELGKHQGKVYGLPVSLSPMTVIYSKEAFAKVGLPEPKAGWTWDDFATAAKQLQPEFTGKDKSGAAVPTWTMMDLILTAGKGPLDPDTGAMESMLTRFRQWYLVDQSLPLTDLAQNDGGYFQKLTKGETGMVLGYWNYSFAHDKPTTEWNMAPLPGSDRTPAIATLAMIAAKAENSETAAAFVKFAAGPAGAVAVAKMPGAPFPGYVDQTSEHIWLANSGVKQEPGFLASFKYIPPLDYPAELAVSVVKQIDAVLYKGVSPADAVQAYKQERETIMAKK